MARKFSKKKRNTETRKQKPIILIIAEGKNVTETQYFKSFQTQHSDYNIKILIPGHITDPAGMQERIEKYWEQNELEEEKGDVAFIVLDLDCDESKAKLITQLEKQSKAAKFVISNPCFEVWFLLHFRYSTRSYYSSSEVVKDLQNFIPGYEKNSDVAPLIGNSLAEALNNAEKLKKHFESLGTNWPSAECNPCTDVPIVINLIKEKNQDI